MRENPNDPSEPVVTERRNDDRTPAEIPAEITGINHAGHLFTEYTLIDGITEGGCYFVTRTLLQCGDMVAVKPLEPGEKGMLFRRPQLLEIASITQHQAGWTVATRTLQSEKLAIREFPPAPYSRRSHGK